jgi:hypothetical protein
MKYILTTLLCALVCSCSTSSVYRTDDTVKEFPRTFAEKVLVYSTDDIGREYIILGQVIASADGGNNSSKSVNIAKKEAAKLGADAILDLRLHIAYGQWDAAVNATATAIKFID